MSASQYFPFSNGLLLILKLSLVFVTGMIGFGMSNYPVETPWNVFTALFLYSVASLVFRFGWVIPMMIFGTLVGMAGFFTPTIRGGGRDWQANQMLFEQWVGTGAGLMWGLFIDRSKSKASPLNDVPSDTLATNRPARRPGPPQ